ncbi:DNA/RNA non-specific endonuclease [Sporolactobacillus pectinivorans]|uniref:DNA/RNA non-specific endonuclease n=1 Tax=Sporolactobacillus pectinivorans TaxID=1591408 RepID=UPI001EFE46B7|nr:DNA/RNA non-specific endonuclease [Sporolactobacillus pectinivorans]
MKRLNQVIFVVAFIIMAIFAGKTVFTDNNNSGHNLLSSHSTSKTNIKNGIQQVASGISASLSSQGSTGKTNDSASKLASLNYQPGSSAVIAVNHNKSTLNSRDWKENKVIYSNIDDLNRTSHPNTAYLESRNMANDSLRVRQYVQPTGWHQKFSNGKAILNRGHLIAYSLSKGIAYTGSYNPSLKSGDQNNPKNLFTQTAFSNQEIQTIYESQVRNALKQGKKVIYQAQAIFNGNDLMAKGVELQAISTDGSLNFNVFIFNVQPGFQFNYADGTSHMDRSITVPTPAGAPHFYD